MTQLGGDGRGPLVDPAGPCDRCGGLAGLGGFWCSDCIRTCREHTQRLDLQRLSIVAELGEAENGDALRWAAIFYARAGIPVFPLVPGTKVPHKGSAGVDDATTDLRRVWVWWTRHPKDNIGIACGVLFDVVDIDVKSGRPGLESLDRLRQAGLLRGVWGKARTPTGGLHLLFAPSGAGNSNHGAGRLGIDYRGRGGYIVAAPSITEDGAYEWGGVDPDRRGVTFDWDAAKHVLGLAKPIPVKADFTGDKSADGLIRTVAEAKEGARNDRLYWAARCAVDDSLNPELLREPARAAGLSDSEISNTLASAARGVAA